MASSPDFAVITAQEVEYRAVMHVMGLKGPIMQTSRGGAKYVEGQVESGGGFRLALACMNDMYNFQSLWLAGQLLELAPKAIFLLGSGCGRLGKGKICDVVVPKIVAYHGCGRLDGATVVPRPYTYDVTQNMSQLIDEFGLYLTVRNGGWNRIARRNLRDHCDVSELPPAFDKRTVFEVKFGVLLSNDLVLSWQTHEQASAFWKHNRDDARIYDMESAGFAYCCSRRTPSVDWAIVRGVSDFGLPDLPGKQHKAAATVAATWLKGFLDFLSGRLAGTERGISPDLGSYDWGYLYFLLTKAQGSNMYVGKTMFITEILTKAEQSRDILDSHLQALAYAIWNGGIIEGQVRQTSEQGPRTIATIRLDRASTFWNNRGR